MSGSADDPAMKQPKSAKQIRRLIGFMIGLGLLVGAGVYLFSDPQQIRSFADHVGQAPLWAIVVVFVGPVANWLCVGLCLHALMRRHGVVGRVEMLSLVGSAWLLNHLPMRPGLVGRVGYHAKVNQIRVRDSIEASVWSMVHAAIANAIALAIVLALPNDLSLIALVGVLLIPMGVCVLLTIVGFMRSDSYGYLMLALVYRYGDVFVWMIRYAAAFAMLGVTITPIQIVLITAASQIAQVIPITGGGLGFREWGVGLAAQMGIGGAVVSMRTAIGADVINRIAETIVVIPLGMICSALVARRLRDWNNQRGEWQRDEGVAERGLTEDESADHTQDQYEPGEPSEQQPADQ